MTSLRKGSIISVVSVPMYDEKNEMDTILDDIGGSFGRFQLLNYILYSVPLFISGLVGIAYVFTTLTLDFR